MNPSQQPPIDGPGREIMQEFGTLVSLACEGQITDQQQQRLERLVCLHEECLTYYLTAMSIHSALPMYCGKHHDDRALLEEMDRLGELAVSAGQGRFSELSQAFSQSCLLPVAARAEIAKKPSPAMAGSKAESTARRFRRFLPHRLRQAPAIALSLALVMVTTVMASERVRTFISEILLPSRFTTAERAGGLAHSASRGRILRGPNKVTGTRRIGSSGNENVSLASLFVFPLPELHRLDQVHSARLEWTLKQKDGDPDFDVDLYGLGYVGRHEFRGRGFWEGGFDDSLRSSYGMRGRSERRVALIDSAVMSTGTEPGRVSVENRRLVEFLRSLYEDGAQAGDLVVFRLNAHVPTLQKPRATGYAVVHPPAVNGLTTPADFPMFWVTARRSVTPDEFALTHETTSAQSMIALRSSGISRSDGRYIERGSRETGARTVGSSSRQGQSLAVTMLFTLPPVREFEKVQYASLECSTLGPIGDPDFSVDLYGLGYSPSGYYWKSCHWEGERDPSPASRYKLAGPTDKPVALIAKNAIVPGDSPGRFVIEGRQLVEFLQSLYDHGAKGGDAIVFRFNANKSTRGNQGALGYRIVLPPAREHTPHAKLPVLSITSQ